MSERVLSQDIKMGCLRSYKASNVIVTLVGEEQEVRACAIGAALLAQDGYEVLNQEKILEIYETFQDQADNVIDEYYPHLSKVLIDLPCDITKCSSAQRKKNRSVGRCIEHLNDIEKWSRESIADWLESLGY